MDKIEVTQADIDAAQAFFRDDRTGLAVKFQLGAEPQPLLEAFARHRLATRTDATPVAWMDLLANAYSQGAEDVHKAFIGDTASFEPDFGEAASDYARSIDFPPATDVAALVEAAKRCIKIVERHNHRQNEKVEDVKLILSAALAPFTKGQNDE